MRTKRTILINTRTFCRVQRQSVRYAILICLPIAELDYAVKSMTDEKRSTALTTLGETVPFCKPIARRFIIIINRPIIIAVTKLSDATDTNFDAETINTRFNRLP